MTQRNLNDLLACQSVSREQDVIGLLHLLTVEGFPEIGKDSAAAKILSFWERGKAERVHLAYVQDHANEPFCNMAREMLKVVVSQ